MQDPRNFPQSSVAEEQAPQLPIHTLHLEQQLDVWPSGELRMVQKRSQLNICAVPSGQTCLLLPCFPKRISCLCPFLPFALCPALPIFHGDRTISLIIIVILVVHPPHSESTVSGNLYWFHISLIILVVFLTDYTSCPSKKYGLTGKVCF